MEEGKIEYRHNVPLDPREVVRVFAAAGMPRPVDDLPRIARMFAHANLVVSAWAAGRLVGICRAITDYSYCCYISEIAVEPAFQQHGIGRALVAQVHDTLGDEVSLILLSVQEAMEFYPKLGFALADNAFVLKRRR